MEKPNLTIGVGGKPLLYYLPLTLAERLGYFKDAGLTVEISTEHSIYFTERKAAIALSRRFSVAGFRPSAFAKITGL